MWLHHVTFRDMNTRNLLSIQICPFNEYLICYLTEVDEIKRRECVIVQETHGISKSKESLDSF